MIDTTLVQARLDDALASWQNLQIAADNVPKEDKDAKHLAIAARDRALEELKTVRALLNHQTAELTVQAAIETAKAVRLQLEANRLAYEAKYGALVDPAGKYDPDGDLPF